MNARGSARERMGGTRAPPHHQVDHQQPARVGRSFRRRALRHGCSAAQLTSSQREQVIRQSPSKRCCNQRVSRAQSRTVAGGRAPRHGSVQRVSSPVCRLDKWGSSFEGRVPVFPSPNPCSNSSTLKSVRSGLNGRMVSFPRRLPTIIRHRNCNDEAAMTRREFIDAALALTLAPRMASAAGKRTAANVARRKLGRTGAEVSCIGVGGYHIGHQEDPSESIRIIRRAIDGGITFLDNCWDYNGGESEIRMGKALRDGYRAKAFLMTKIDGRDGETAASQIDESLQRLRTDNVDLLQLHEVIREDDPDRAFAAGGAIEAMIAARKAGKARFLGFTGHKSPRIHLKMLDTAKAKGFHFDAVQMPLNVMDAHFDSFEKQVLPRLVREGIAALAMKPMGDPFILETGTASALERLDQALSVAREGKLLSEKEVNAVLARTAEAAKTGSVEKYKTSHHFDGTVQHPEWLGPRAG